jgi:hypothetical protein
MLRWRERERERDEWVRCSYAVEVNTKTCRWRLSRTGDIRSSERCIKTSVACRRCTFGTDKGCLLVSIGERVCGVVVRVGPGLPECMAAAIVSSLLSSIASTLPRQASKVCLACLPASARRACPGPCSRLSMCTTGYDRLPH